MGRNEIAFLRFPATRGPSNFNLVFIEIHISSEQQKGWALCEMSIVRRVGERRGGPGMLSRYQRTRERRHDKYNKSHTRAYYTSLSPSE